MKGQGTESVLYFGYGSNLNHADWASRGYREGVIKPIGRAFIQDYELAFNWGSETWGGRVLNLKPKVGVLTEGVLFECGLTDLNELRRKEGHPGCYREERVAVLREDGTLVQAITYIVPPERTCTEKELPLSTRYLEIVRAGYRDHGLSTQALDAAAAGGSWSAPCKVVQVL